MNPLISELKVAKVAAQVIDIMCPQLTKGETLYMLAGLLLTGMKQADFTKEEVAAMCEKLKEEYESY